jgi:hypothetical protein
MTEFKITSSRKQRLATVFKTDPKTVNILNKVFNSLNLKGQYLAHIIRAMEEYIRKTTGNALFRLICEPSLGDLEVGGAQYFSEKFFVVHYNPRMQERELRVYLAHELGHLFILAIVNNNRAPRDRIPSDADVEPLSSIFGILTVANKNDFYQNIRNNTQLNHQTWDEMEQVFLSLKKKRTAPISVI